MAKFCEGCGHPIKSGDQFCDKCGRRVAQPAAVQPADYNPPRKKSRVGLIIGLMAAAAVIVFVVLAAGGVIAIFAFSDKPTPAPTVSPTATPDGGVDLLAFPEEFMINKNDIKVNCNYRYPDKIIPANYRSLDYVVYLQCWTDRGRAKALVTVEIPGFTQKYEQMVEVSRSETELVIHPPLLEGVAQTLVAAKDAQLLITVKDADTGTTWLQDTKEIKLWSFYDMQWESEDGSTPYYENILAWVTPQNKQVDALINAADPFCNSLSNGDIGDIIGYQGASANMPGEYITAVQVCAIMKAMASTFNVNYSNKSFSSTNSQVQSIATPEMVLRNSAGLCIETAVTIASAIQRTNMHAVIILLPGHAQVAVETYYMSGEYFLVETTALDAARSASTLEEFLNYGILTYKNKAEWTAYLKGEGMDAIDCNLAEDLKIMPLD